MAPMIDPSVRSDFRRALKRLESPSAAMMPADHVDIMRRLLHAIEHDVRTGHKPDERQLVNLAAHALIVAMELSRAA
jgi:hypothetical protein